MRKFIDHERIKTFIFRRKANFFGLLAITLLSLAMTVVFALLHSPRTRILVAVTVLLALLCVLQLYRMRSSYRTIPSFRGFRKKKKDEDQ